MFALKKTLNNDYISRVANCDFVFVMWNTIISLDVQISNDTDREPSEDSDQACFMAKGMTPLR